MSKFSKVRPLSPGLGLILISSQPAIEADIFINSLIYKDFLISSQPALVPISDMRRNRRVRRQIKLEKLVPEDRRSSWWLRGSKVSCASRQAEVVI